MSINISLNRILIALIVSLIAVGGYLLATDVLHWPAWVCLWVFGFILLALNASVTVS